MQENNEYLKNQSDLEMIVRTFVNKEVDIQQPNVQAAIISAASGMSVVSDFATKEQVESVILDLFMASDNEDVKNLIGMPPQYVNANIGFATDYNDYSAAKIAYDARKSEYDCLYSMINERSSSLDSQKQL